MPLKRVTVWSILLLVLASASAALLMRAVSDSGEGDFLFLGWDSKGQVQLYMGFEGGRTPRELTSQNAGIIDYAISPDGRQVVYSTPANGGDTGLWRLLLAGKSVSSLLMCEDADCRAPSWHPDGVRLLYERRAIESQGTLGFPQLWWLDTSNSATEPLLPGDAYGEGARFSPDGEWISFVAGPEQGIRVQRLDSKQGRQLPSSPGSPAVWSPDGTRLITRDRRSIVIHAEDGVDHQSHGHEYGDAVALHVTELATFVTKPLGGGEIADDGAPVWSPDGEWIAFGRKSARGQDGRQIWLIQPDGEGARALTARPDLHHGAIAWSADGSTLLFQRLQVVGGDERPSIWMMSLADGSAIKLQSEGFLPAWLR